MVKQSDPLFTIGIPTFNRVELLKQTLQSILNQTYDDFEIIISNDYVNEKLTEKSIGISDKRIRIYNQKVNLGEAGNMNFLLSKARGKYFTWQFDDDIYSSQFLELIESLLSQQRNILCVYSGVGYIYGRKYPNLKSVKNVKKTIYNGKKFVFDFLKGKVSVAGCCGVFDKVYLNKINGIKKLSKTPIAIHSEFLLILKTIALKKVGYLNNKLVFSRDYEGSFSGSNNDYLQYEKAGKNLLIEGMKLIKNNDFDQSDVVEYLQGLINIIMQFYIMRISAFKGSEYRLKINFFLGELIKTLKQNKKFDMYKTDELFSSLSKKKWLITRIKAYIKWHSPRFFYKIIKKTRSRISITKI